MTHIKLKAWICPECKKLNESYTYPTRCSRCGHFRKVEKKPKREEKGIK